MKSTLSPLQSGIVRFLESNETWLRPLLVEKCFQGVDLKSEGDRLANPAITFPEYYKEDFHSVKGGYLNSDAALTYDPITSKILVPNEEMLRNETVNRVPKDSHVILDLGCGTGTATRAIAKALPHATVTGVDLSPYMIAAATRKAEGIANVSFLHANAEALPYDDACVDCVTISLLFHEMPPDIGVSVLKEAYRVLKPGGSLVIFDGAQYSDVAKLGGTISSTLFLEPYAEAFLKSDLKELMTVAGFTEVKSDVLVVFYEIRTGKKAA